MDYEKMYKEALERAKKFEEKYGGGYAEYIFPELAESKDERIRRKMIEHFKAKTKETWCNMPVKDIIAYLEKQEIFSKNGEGCYYYHADGSYTFIGSMGLGPIEDIKLNGERPKTENKGVDLPGACLCVEKQKEPHKRLRDKTPWIVTAKEELAHDEERLQANLEELHRIRAEKEKQKEQKPVEYLDKEKVYAIMKKLTSLSFCIPLGSDEEKRIDEITRDVRSLLDYPIEQKPEWSEEDEKNCNRIIRFLEPHKTFFPTKETKEEMQNWLNNRLKSLRPQPSWKPSEEQIHAIIEALKYLPNNKDEWMVLNTLVDVFKKLI